VPSWELHRRIYDKLSREIEGFSVWTPGLLESIDEIIDKGGEHDLGRKPDPLSFRKMLYALWLEFGDIYDTFEGKFLGLKSELERRMWLNRLISRGFLQSPRYKIYIPDDALMLATLHHILDLCMQALRELPIREENAKLILRYADEGLKHYVRELEELTALHGRSFKEVYEWLIGVLEDRITQIYRLLADGLSARGIPIGCGPEGLRNLLVNYVKTRGYHGIVYVNGGWLPVAAAAIKAFNELMRGNKVTLGFSRHPQVIYEEIKASTLKELCDRLRASPTVE